MPLTVHHKSHLLTTSQLIQVSLLGFAFWFAVAILVRYFIATGSFSGTATASFCDGIALTWARGLYGPGAEQVLPGAACILWGVGCVMTAAYIDSYREE